MATLEDEAERRAEAFERRAEDFRAKAARADEAGRRARAEEASRRAEEAGPPTLTQVRVPDGTTQIKNHQFQDRTDIWKVILPDTLTHIGQSAFMGCTSLARINFPHGLESIGLYAFESCRALKQVQIPGSVRVIGTCAFRYCTSLARINFPHGLESIGLCAFEACRALKQFQIPGSVREIGVGAFQNCTRLEMVSILEGTAKISVNAFKGCSKLKYVVIPDSVRKIEFNAFGDCAQIKNVLVPAGTDISPSAFAEGTRIIRRAVVIPLSTDVIPVYTQHTPASVPPPPLAPRAVAVPPAPAACSVPEYILKPDGMTFEELKECVEWLIEKNWWVKGDYLNDMQIHSKKMNPPDKLFEYLNSGGRYNRSRDSTQREGCRIWKPDLNKRVTVRPPGPCLQVLNGVVTIINVATPSASPGESKSSVHFFRKPRPEPEPEPDEATCVIA